MLTITKHSLSQETSIIFSLIVLLFSILFSLSSCRSNPDFEKLRAEILKLHQENINAHWQKNADYFTKNLAEEFVQVQNGEIKRPGKNELKKRMKNYLDNTSFTEYKDLMEPIIDFSEDGTIGWSIVQVKVTGTNLDADGRERNLNFICAWITLYERKGDSWLKVTEVSNFK